MSKEHTCGEWGFVREGSAYAINIFDDNGNDFLFIAETIGGHGRDTDLANARLIAAAPNLLEALMRIMDNDCPLTGNPTHAELVKHWKYEKSQGRGEADDRLFALEALAKARGR